MKEMLVNNDDGEGGGDEEETKGYTYDTHTHTYVCVHLLIYKYICAHANTDAGKQRLPNVECQR